MRLAVYGGSFDPPHVAHVLAADYALSVGVGDRVLVLPVFGHAFGKNMESFVDRCRMCELAFGHIEGVEVSRLEAELSPPNYTLHTLRLVQQRYPGAELRLVVGSDVLLEGAHWHRFEDVKKLAPLFALGRVGYDHPSAPPPVLPDISSTEVRDLLRRRRDAQVEKRLRALVPRRVLDYVDEHDLYRQPMDA